MGISRLGDQRAFPYILPDEQNLSTTDFSPGMSKREKIAESVLSAMITGFRPPATWTNQSIKDHADKIAKEALFYTEALLKQLDKPTENG